MNKFVTRFKGKIIPNHLDISDTFNVTDLSFFFCGDDLTFDL